jgi:hypothetical protein
MGTSGTANAEADKKSRGRTNFHGEAPDSRALPI